MIRRKSPPPLKNLCLFYRKDLSCNWWSIFKNSTGETLNIILYKNYATQKGIYMGMELWKWLWCTSYIFRYPIVHRWKVQQTKVYSRNMRVYNTKSFLHRFVVRCKLHSSFSFGPVADCDYKLINTRLQTWIHVNVKGRGMRNITIPNELICTVS